MFHLPTKVYFGSQTLKKVGEETAKLGKRALIASGRNFARKTGILKKVEDLLKKAGVEVILFEEVEPNPSIKTVGKGADLSKGRECDVIIGLGGGSAMDVAKGIAVLSTNPGPLTHYLGRDKVALVDPQLTLSLPLSITADSGVDALSQAIESYISKRSQPLSEILALKAVELLAQYLPQVIKNPKNLEFRSFCLYASLLGGMAIAHTGTVLVHGMSNEL